MRTTRYQNDKKKQSLHEQKREKHSMHEGPKQVIHLEMNEPNDAEQRISPEGEGPKQVIHLETNESNDAKQRIGTKTVIHFLCFQLFWCCRVYLFDVFSLLRVSCKNSEFYVFFIIS